MIFLSAGHSTVDPGAGVDQVIDGKHFRRNEADVVEDFRDMVALYLRKADIPYQADGVGDQNQTLAQTIRLIGKNRPAVEFHCNAGPPAATGVETLSADRDMALGAKLCVAIADTLKIRNRGAKSEGSGQHHRLGFVQAGGIIVELFFITSAYDLAQYDARKWLAAKAVAEVLKEAVS